MPRLIDAETLEEQGWIMQRTVRVDASTMEWQQRKPTEFPAEQYVPRTSYDSLEDTCKSLRKALAYAVPVVRCKDCKWFAGEGMYCANNIMVTFDHFYCADGDEKDETD